MSTGATFHPPATVLNHLSHNILRFYSSTEEIFQWEHGHFTDDSEHFLETFAAAMGKPADLAPTGDFIFVNGARAVPGVEYGTAALRAYIECQQNDGLLYFELVLCQAGKNSESF